MKIEDADIYKVCERESTRYKVNVKCVTSGLEIEDAISVKWMRMARMSFVDRERRKDAGDDHHHDNFLFISALYLQLRETHRWRREGDDPSQHVEKAITGIERHIERGMMVSQGIKNMQRERESGYRKSKWRSKSFHL